MAYNPPTEKTADTDTFELTDYNILRDNWLASALAIVTTKGDIVIATAANALARLGVGSFGDELTPDSGEATGLKWQGRPACHLTASGAIDTDDTGTWTSIECDTETGDTHSMHDTGTNPERITIPANGAGWYTVGGWIQGSGASPNEFDLRILLNGTTELVSQSVRAYGQTRLHVNVAYPLSVGDYLELQWNVSSVDTDFDAGAAFWAIYQRPS